MIAPGAEIPSQRWRLSLAAVCEMVGSRRSFRGADTKSQRDPTSSGSHRPGNSKPQTMSDKLVAATETGTFQAHRSCLRWICRLRKLRRARVLSLSHSASRDIGRAESGFALPSHTSRPDAALADTPPPSPRSASHSRHSSGFFRVRPESLVPT
jgi:hypothetical protein